MRVFRPTIVLNGLAAAVAGLMLTASPARATSLIDDPLHGFCGSSWSTSTCTSNSSYQGGAITPFSSLTTFGFIADPGDVTGFSYMLAILVPDSLAAQNFILNETLNGNPVVSNVSAVSQGTWTSASGLKLDDFLGLTNTNPTNSFGGLGGPASTAFGSTVTGFDVYLASFGGPNTLPNQSNSTSTNTPLFSLASGSDQFSKGMEIVGFLVAYDTDKDGIKRDKEGNPIIVTIGTPSSSVLLDTGVCLDCGGGGGQSAVPEPASLLLFGTGLGLVARRARRRKKA